MVTNEDLKNARDQFCGTCKTKKTKYLGLIMGTSAVMYKPNCDCTSDFSSSSTDKDKKMWEHISTPWWVHAGLAPKTDVEKKQVAHLKKHNMSWGDLRKERDMRLGARYTTGMQAYQEYKKNGGK